MRLEPVSIDSIKSYYKKHYDDGVSTYKRNANIIRSLIKDYPSNKTIQHVLPKAIVINHLYNTNIFAIDKMADHITQLNISDRLSKADPTVVSEIATGHGIKSTKRDKEFEFYSFATKYAWCHNRTGYHIYDRNVDCILWEYQKLKDRFHKFSRTDLKDYEKYIAIMNVFKEKYNLHGVDNDQLDKFLWKQGEYFLKEKKRKREVQKNKLN